MTTTVPTPLAPVAAWPSLREMAAPVAQQTFHVLMEAFSLPGTLRTLPADPAAGPIPAAVAPLRALADLMTPVTGLDPVGAEAVEAIARLTGAPVVGPEEARFALALGDPGDFTSLCSGSHWSPEKGAMLVQRVGSLASVEAAAAPGDWRLTGPGVPQQAPRLVRVTGLPEAWLTHRRALVADYPAGVDCLLITDEGELVALSRTTVIEVI